MAEFRIEPFQEAKVLAIDEVAAGFYTRFGFEPLLDSPRHLYMPIGAIEEAFS